MKMLSLNSFRYCIEFSSILVLIMLGLMHEMGDVTFAKQIKIDNPNNPIGDNNNNNPLAEHQFNFDQVTPSSFSSDTDSASLSSQNFEDSVDQSDFLSSTSWLRFTPDSMNFGKTEIGKPIISTVHVHNVHPEKSIRMISLNCGGISRLFDTSKSAEQQQNQHQHGSSDRGPFHCSSIEEKMLEPRSNTTLTITFLPRHEGLVNNTLRIHTSIGVSKLNLIGIGESSIFRVRPLVGAKISLNSNFSSFIHVYNPFPTPLQLTEIYSSGTDLQLETLDFNEIASKFPSVASRFSGKDSSVPELWTIPAFDYHVVMKANYVGKTVTNYTSFIRMKLKRMDDSSTDEENSFQIVLPFEIQVSDKLGLYPVRHELFYGLVLGRVKQTTSNEIAVVNTGIKNIVVEKIEFQEDQEGSMGSIIHFDGPKIVEPSHIPIVIGRLELNSINLTCTGVCRGNVIITTNEQERNRIELPFVVSVPSGELHISESVRTFLDYQSWNHLQQHQTSKKHHHSGERIFRAENRFDFPLLIHSIKWSNWDAIQVQALDSVGKLVIPPGGSAEIAKATQTLDPSEKPPSFCEQWTKSMIVVTNLTEIFIPVRYYSSKCIGIFVHGSQEELFVGEEWDLGRIARGEIKSTYFFMMNRLHNTLRLRAWSATINGISIELAGNIKFDAYSPGGNRFHPQFHTVNLQKLGPEISKRKTGLTLLDENNYSVFKLKVKGTGEQGVQKGSIRVATRFQDVFIPFRYTLTDGNLTVPKIVLPKTFPGRMVTGSLTIKSRYSEPIEVKSVSMKIPDDRFTILYQPDKIYPGEDNQILVVFNPSANCPPSVCYTSLDIEKEVGHLWLLGNGVYSDTAYIDKELYKLLRNQWMELNQGDLAPTAQYTIQLEPSSSSANSLPTAIHAEIQAQLHWPRLSNKFALRFAPLRVGRTSIKDLVVENPADKPIVVQVIHVANYPNAEILVQSIMFHQHWATGDIESIEKTIRDSSDYSPFGIATSSSQGQKLPETNRINEYMGVAPSPDSYAMVLAPGGRQRLAISFRPLVERNFTSLLILRNNLTVIEVVVLRGEGGRGLLKIEHSPRESSLSSGARKETSTTLPNSKSPLQFCSKPTENAASSKIIFEFSKTTLDRLCRRTSSQATSLNNEDVIVHGGGGGGSQVDNDTLNNFVIRSKFKATNVGRMALGIRKFFIDKMPCEGYGFRVKNCEPMTLQPNQSFELEMTYSPDFTQPTVFHDLYVLIDDEHTRWQHFELIVRVPKEYLAPCLAALPRPSWELYVGKCLFWMAAFLISLTVCVAYTDATRLCSNVLFGQAETDSNVDEDLFQNDVDGVDDGDFSTTCEQTKQGGSPNSNGGVGRNARNLSNQQQNKVRQRKNVARNSSTLNQQQPQNSKKPKNEKQYAGGEASEKSKLTTLSIQHQDSSSSEDNEVFENLSTSSDPSSSNRQSTESLFDGDSQNSRKNSMENSLGLKYDKKKNEENVAGGKKKKGNKIDWRKLDIAQPEVKNDNFQSLYFPPIEEFETILKNRSSAHVANKAKFIEEKSKKKDENKKTGAHELNGTKKSEDKKLSSKNSSSGVISSGTSKSAWNFEKIEENHRNLAEMWNQPSELTMDFFRDLDQPRKSLTSQTAPATSGTMKNQVKSSQQHYPPTTTTNRQQDNAGWIIDDWSNDLMLAAKAQLNGSSKAYINAQQQKHQQQMQFMRQQQQSPGYFGLRFDSERKSPLAKTFNNSWQPSQGSSGLWDRPTQSARCSTSSTTATVPSPFSPIIAPTRTTSPLPAQIRQQDSYFQSSLRNIGADSRFDFHDFIPQRPTNIAPPPGFGNTPENNTFSQWFSSGAHRSVSGGSTLQSRSNLFEPNSIWNSTESNLNSWPTTTARTSKPPSPDVSADNLWRLDSLPTSFVDSSATFRSSNNDLWSSSSTAERRTSAGGQLSRSPWSFDQQFHAPPISSSTSSLEFRQQRPISTDLSRVSPNPAPSPAPSSSSSSNGRQNN